ncbi:response regulator [Thalassotalea sp. G2M2-11]|uniref:response regulator n=1 Tax=Thalassotalea sp. G2M2-11 TaxID=2787627 RepID=UPI0019D19DC4|nr:response regulator [Thalassotalea sp. G2M2-11]
MSKHTILIIDDEQSYLELLSEALEDKFTVYSADCLHRAEAVISDVGMVDIALVDENIGQEKGSDWIKDKVAENNVAKSFVLYSGLATEDAILKGLECGADDFLAKPISLLALSNKLEKLITYQEQIHHFEDELSSKDRVINISMAQASKYGSCMQLTSRLNNCFTIEKIRDEVFSYLYSTNLQGCIAFYPLNEAPSFFSSKNGLCSPVEIDVMKLLKIKPRLYRFGTRTIFNHPLVSILILNLEEGAIDTDIYIDALASVIECIGARMAFITYKNSLTTVQDQIQEAVTKTKHMIEKSKHHQKEVMGEIVQNIGMSFHVLDMTMEQEEYLTDLVQTALNKHSQDEALFVEVGDLLDKALASVDELKELNTLQSASQSEDELDEEDELF